MTDSETNYASHAAQEAIAEGLSPMERERRQCGQNLALGRIQAQDAHLRQEALRLANDPGAQPQQIVERAAAYLAFLTGADIRVTETTLTDAQIKHMVSRFLSWKLPANFNPDAGISFKPTFNDHLDPPMRNEPIGTNLFDAIQAEAMVRHMLDGLPTEEGR